MKKQKLIMVVTIMAMGISACASKKETVTQTTAFETTVKVTEDIETTGGSELLTTSASETVGINPEQESFDTLEAYLNNYADSKTHYLLYDIALNENANTLSDEGVTYLFSKDDNGNRILGTVMAYYKGNTGMDVSGQEEFCNSFVSTMFPELTNLLIKAETYSENGYWGKIITFSDYSITLMPDNSLNGMSVILSKND